MVTFKAQYFNFFLLLSLFIKCVDDIHSSTNQHIRYYLLQIFFFEIVGWLKVLRPIACLCVWDYSWNALRGSLSKELLPVFIGVSEKTPENSQRLGR